MGQTKSHQDGTTAKKIVALVAGPMYVDMQCGQSYEPSIQYHTELAPPPNKSWGESRGVGGAAWKVAQYWAGHLGGVTFVSRLPEVSAEPIGDWAQRAFVDDERWLHENVHVQAAAQKDLELEITSSKKTVDYTFHLAHPDEPMWPILSVKGGAAAELCWSDILDAWNKHDRGRLASDTELVVFLSGVLRTRLLETLYDALLGPANSKVARDTKVLLATAKLFIDFGRTDLRMDDTKAAEQRQTIILRCLEAAHTVLMDYSTATKLALLDPDRLATGDKLIVRPYGVLPGEWWLYKKQPRRKGPPKLLRQTFEAPEPEEARGEGAGDSGRPARVAELIHRRCQGKRLGTDWEKVPDVKSFIEPGDITEDPDYRRDLVELKHRAERTSGLERLLIWGESGTGKEVVSRWLHRIHPARSGGDYHPITSGRMVGDIVDAELFGTVKGAFTGAIDRPGAFEAAHGGVLEIDDLETLNLATQAKLLRVIEDGEVGRLGSNKLRKVDVLVIVTTNEPPDLLVREGRLRADLYYRLRTDAYLEIPPLRLRKGDAVRAARDGWERLNAIWTTAFPWPATLESWIMASRLPGNYRTVEQAVSRTHEMTRRKRKPLPGGVDVPRDLDELEDTKTQPSSEARLSAVFDQVARVGAGIEELVKRSTKLPPPPPLPDRHSPLFDEVKNAAAEKGISSRLSFDKQLAILLDLWEGVCRRYLDAEHSLTKREITKLLGLAPESKSDLRKVMRALGKHKKDGAWPKLEVEGRGGERVWKIVLEG